ncbi:arginine--tRNA ligase [Candidatus Parcubacteria bacterium]|nr:arginine--tRNA ligase [Candidatus Parcubacteria bacterium]
MVKEALRRWLSGALNSPAEKIRLEISKNSVHGDYSLNILSLASAIADLEKSGESVKSGLSPTTRGKLEHALEKEKPPQVKSFEILPSGFINIFITDEALTSELERIGDHLEKGFGFLSGRKINLEFVSANPTGELHIGHGRGAFYGDTLANVLAFAGASITREYYINDSRESNQIKELGKTALGLGETYLTDRLKEQMGKLSSGAKDPGETGFELSRIVQADNREFIEGKLGVKFDEWYSEDERLRASLLNDRTFAALKMKDLVYEKDGAWWLKTSEHGDDEDRVVIRSDGTKSYFLSDISYHSDKFARGFDTVLDVWGADHHGHVKRMQAAKEMLGWKGTLRIFITQLVTLKEGKMSKRAGNVIYLRDLVEEYGLDVVRWFFSEKSLNTHMEFDAARAKERSEKNPVFYVQYAHARIVSLLEKAKGVAPDTRSLAAVMQEGAARQVAIELLKFEEMIEQSLGDFQVHRLTSYAYSLAAAFSGFYRDVRIIDEASYHAGAYALARSTKVALAKTLSLLGISAPVKM